MKFDKREEKGIKEYMEYSLEELQNLVENPNEIEPGCEPHQMDTCIEYELKLINEAIRRLENK